MVFLFTASTINASKVLLGIYRMFVWADDIILTGTFYYTRSKTHSCIRSFNG